MLKIKTPFLPEATRKHILKLLKPHGITIEVHELPGEGERYPYCLFHLPEGTRRERVGFTGAYHEHNKIILPDGFIFFQEVDAQSWSSISFPIEERGTNE